MSHLELNRQTQTHFAHSRYEKNRPAPNGVSQVVLHLPGQNPRTSILKDNLGLPSPPNGVSRHNRTSHVLLDRITKVELCLGRDSNYKDCGEFSHQLNVIRSRLTLLLRRKSYPSVTPFHPQYRTTRDIVWSSLAFISCAWISIHPLERPWTGRNLNCQSG